MGRTVIMLKQRMAFLVQPPAGRRAPGSSRPRACRRGAPSPAASSCPRPAGTRLAGPAGPAAAASGWRHRQGAAAPERPGPARPGLARSAPRYHQARPGPAWRGLYGRRLAGPVVFSSLPRAAGLAHCCGFRNIYVYIIYVFFHQFQLILKRTKLCASHWFGCLF